ncbi:MAG TPA: hypothetical protein VG675_05135 [Bryobacteraceae bacterium]|nr:hypothetical protein [Bryobacteraceae bacterium]
MGGEKYIDIPGTETHELPPLLVHSPSDHVPAGARPDLSAILVEAEDMLAMTDAADDVIEQRKFDLALQLAEQYKGLVSHWQWGNSVLEWIRQCELTFEWEAELRDLLHPDVWPHAGRASFVTLLADKAVPTPGVVLKRAVGLRLTFRQPPPIDCFSSQFLVYLNSTVADSAYRTWAHLGSQQFALLPPERFHFEVLNMDESA